MVSTNKKRVPNEEHPQWVRFIWIYIQQAKPMPVSNQISATTACADETTKTEQREGAWGWDSREHDIVKVDRF